MVQSQCVAGHLGILEAEDELIWLGRMTTQDRLAEPGDLVALDYLEVEFSLAARGRQLRNSIFSALSMQLFE